MVPPDSYFENPEFVRVEDCFHDYVAQGEGRNPAWLARKAGVSIQVACKAIVAGNWMQRIAAIAKDAAKQTQKKLVGDVSGLNESDVGALTIILTLAEKALVKAIEEDRCSPATLAKIVHDTRTKRREILGLGAGQEGDIVGRMQKLLGDVTDDPDKPKEPEFKLDLDKLAAPPELPEMPGMISDEEEKTDEDEEDGEDDQQA
jgi:hypothetical protein